jgi:CheY-like chemotaxis protein
MPKVLIVAAADLGPELGRSVLWRSDIDRVCAPTHTAGLEAARRLQPNLILLDDTDPPATLSLIAGLRDDPVVRRVSIAVLSRARALSLQEEESLRRAGANLVLSGEVEPTLWDSRLEELLDVPRRREVRVPVQFAVWSRLGPSDPAVEGLALNLSVRGMLLESDQPLDVGARLDLSFSLPRGDAAELRVVGQVVREAASTTGRPRTGIEFLILRGDARERIRAFVEDETGR